ncbi:SHOCT domain-containing protein [Natronorubrum sp. FCH18a]|uniref:SHOCT domain-containing protein n=1 Tax=Natronorubrum sp. FCH18a TaxID=3447018 RepID=UPI003F50F617
MVSRHWLYFSGFVISAVLLVGAGLIGIVDALSVLSGGMSYGEEFILLAMLGEAAEWVMVGLILGLFAVLFLAATVVSILRSTSIPRSDRLVSIVEWVERKYPVLRQFDASGKVTPTTEDRKQQIKEQYIAGEISEAEFERKMEQVMDDGSPDQTSRYGNSTTVEMKDR